MSQIFDALRRTEAEHAETDRAAQEAATEILRRAEKRQQAGLVGKEPVDGHESQEVVSADLLPELKFNQLTQASAYLTTETDEKSVLDSADVVEAFPSVDTAVPPAGKLPCLTDKESPTVEAFRLLTVRLRELRRIQQMKTFLITSTIPEEGKSFVSTNLATALAQGTDQKVLLMEGDLRRPTVASVFGLGAHPGLCEWLKGTHKLSESITHLTSAGIWVMPSGETPENPLDVLQSKKLPQLIKILNEKFDWIIIDSPPVLPLADTSVWSNLADAILLVTRQGTTQKRLLRSGLETIDSQKLIGAVINCATKSSHADYYYYRSE